MTMAILSWRRSSRCADAACVEVAAASDRILLRGSEEPRVVVSLTPAEWTAFLAGVKAGDFDGFGSAAV